MPDWLTCKRMRPLVDQDRTGRPTRRRRTRCETRGHPPPSPPSAFLVQWRSVFASTAIVEHAGLVSEGKGRMLCIGVCHHQRELGNGETARLPVHVPGSLKYDTDEASPDRILIRSYRCGFYWSFLAHSRIPFASGQHIPS